MLTRLLTQVDVSEALSGDGVRCVLIYAFQAQAGQLGLIEEPRLGGKLALSPQTLPACPAGRCPTRTLAQGG